MVVATLRAILNKPVERGMIGVNPANRLGHFYSNKTSKIREEFEIFTPEDIPILLSSMIARYGHQNYTVALTPCHTGLRADDLAGLHWKDIDSRAKTIAVRRQYQQSESHATQAKAENFRQISNYFEEYDSGKRFAFPSRFACTFRKLASAPVMTFRLIGFA